MTLTQLDATPTTWLAVGYDLRGGSMGMAHLRFRWRDEAARLDVGDRRYRLKPSPEGGTYTLERRGRKIASATWPADLGRSFSIDYRGERWDLRARPKRKAFRIVRQGRRVAEIGPASWYRRHARLEAPFGIEDELAYFLMGLTLLWWRRKRIA